MMMSERRQPTYFLSHGGGPWPWLMESAPGVFDKLDRFIKDIPAQLPEKPRAILVISGHWEEAEFTVMSGAQPPMVYDYGGFPEFTYHITYPAPGDPALATQIQNLLLSAGINARLDAQRGFDHGTFSITYPMYPSADVPVIQLSMKNGYDPMLHIEVGRALGGLRKQGVLIIGSGNSYHNLRRLDGGKEQSIAFDNWLHDATLTSTGAERAARLADWAKAPFARFVHPSEDHLIPLMVAAGAAAEEPATLVYNEMFMNRFMVSSLRFG